jgi:hypothetical protein
MFFAEAERFRAVPVVIVQNMMLLSCGVGAILYGANAVPPASDFFKINHAF